MTDSEHAGSWRVLRLHGSAQELHDRPPPDPPERQVWICEVDRPALVLGSAQDASAVVPRPKVVPFECGMFGPKPGPVPVEVAKRHSGGGAVLLVPGEMTWIDLIIPGTDPLWERDVGKAFGWVGELWRAAVISIASPLGAVLIHDGAMTRNRWSKVACFAGLGPGEVTVTEVTTGHRKLVGLSQRRTRAAVRFQCLVHHRFDPAALPELLALTQPDRAQLTNHLADHVTPLPTQPAHVCEALLSMLPP